MVPPQTRRPGRLVDCHIASAPRRPRERINVVSSERSDSTTSPGPPVVDIRRRLETESDSDELHQRIAASAMLLEHMRGTSNPWQVDRQERMRWLRLVLMRILRPYTERQHQFNEYTMVLLTVLSEDIELMGSQLSDLTGGREDA